MITGEKIYLRALEPSDINILYNWENDTALWTSEENNRPISRNDLEALIAQSDLDIYQTRQMRLMISTLANGHTAGCIDVFNFNPFNMSAGVGILVSEPFRQQGIATDALRTFVGYLFGTLNLRTLCADVAYGNTASIRLFERCGFNHIGTRRQWIRQSNGQYTDELMFQLLRE